MIKKTLEIRNPFRIWRNRGDLIAFARPRSSGGSFRSLIASTTEEIRFASFFSRDREEDGEEEDVAVVGSTSAPEGDHMGRIPALRWGKNRRIRWPARAPAIDGAKEEDDDKATRERNTTLCGGQKRWLLGTANERFGLSWDRNHRQTRILMHEKREGWNT